MALLDAALGYAGRGWAVFPCAGKRPITPHGFKDASTDPAQIKAWWAANQNANIGLYADGSGLAIIDVDAAKGGFDSLQSLRDTFGEAAFETLTCYTGGGGYHLYFQRPEGDRLPNDTGAAGLPGIDIRTAGYVIMPPSIHPNGDPYQWLNNLPILDMPAGLVEMFRKGKPEPPIEPRTFAPAPIADNRARAYAESALDAELRILAGQQPGGQNDALNKCAFALGQLVGGGLLSRSDVESRIERVMLALPCGNGPWTPANMAHTMRSGLDAGERDPRGVPADDLARRPSGIRTANWGVDVADLPAGEAPAECMVDLQVNDTDTGNACRFVTAHSRDAFYCAATNTWHVWDGSRWAKDDTKNVQELAKDTVRRIYREALTHDGDERTRRIKWAMKSEDGKRLREMLGLASSDPAVAVRLKDLDPDAYLLNCPNGTLDMRNGTLTAHDPDQRITRSTGVPFNADAQCPLWMSFLADVMEPTPEIIPFLQRSIGYSLTGSTREQCMFILHGSGRNGKSTFIDVLAHILGDYAVQVPARTFDQGHKDSETQSHVASLAGVYLATAEESERTSKLATGLVKQATGSKALSGKRLYQNPITFEPRFKLWLATNYRPEITDTDEGIWRRIRLIPWAVQFDGDSADKDLGRKLLEESEGILTWAVRGCADYWQSGLMPPDVVTRTTADYRADSDVMGTFIAECLAPSDNGHIPMARVHDLYTTWAKRNGEDPVSATKLTRAFNARDDMTILKSCGVATLYGHVARTEEADHWATRDLPE